jgi:hypothetical protein
MSDLALYCPQCDVAERASGEETDFNRTCSVCGWRVELMALADVRRLSASEKPSHDAQS